jgi:Ser/Thr protein kinase RdoA (MazF antagonist)
MIRLRPVEACRDEFIQFEHETLRTYRSHGLPVPSALRTRDGGEWLDTRVGRLEVFEWLAGEPFQPKSLEQIRSLATFLARFHGIGRSIYHPGKDGVRREDHPDAVKPYLSRLYDLSPNSSQRSQLDKIGAELAVLGIELSDARCAVLPSTVIHGDLHPGNVAFDNNRLCAAYDFDYLSRQPRCRDLIDGMMFFAAHRDSPMDATSIRSITQPMTPLLDECAAWLSAYGSMEPIADKEWDAFPAFIRARWVQIRLRGARKLPESERIDFVLDRFDEPLRWLDREAPRFFAALKQGNSA